LYRLLCLPASGILLRLAPWVLLRRAAVLALLAWFAPSFLHYRERVALPVSPLFQGLAHSAHAPCRVSGSIPSRAARRGVSPGFA
jgi:hypothetical protein